MLSTVRLPVRMKFLVIIPTLTAAISIGFSLVMLSLWLRNTQLESRHPIGIQVGIVGRFPSWARRCGRRCLSGCGSDWMTHEHRDLCWQSEPATRVVLLVAMSSRTTEIKSVRPFPLGGVWLDTCSTCMILTRVAPMRQVLPQGTNIQGVYLAFGLDGSVQLANSTYGILAKPRPDLSSRVSLALPSSASASPAPATQTVTSEAVAGAAAWQVTPLVIGQWYNLSVSIASESIGRHGTVIPHLNWTISSAQ